MPKFVVASIVTAIRNRKTSYHLLKKTRAILKDRLQP